MPTAECLTAAPATAPRPIVPLARTELDDWLATQPDPVVRWVRENGFNAEPGAVCVIPGDDGGVGSVVAGRTAERTLWDWAQLPGRLPPGVYRIEGTLDPAEADQAALGWVLATYRFDRYRQRTNRTAILVWPETTHRAHVERTATALFLVRDLINTPAGDLGPEHLAAAVETVAGRYGADCSSIIGDDLLAHNYPSVHAIGRASARAPRLIDLRWGEDDGPRVTLVGKGVCFDTGGLNIKNASGMKLMKKDMGGAAIMLGVAQMVMAAGLPVRLRLLIPAVDNSIAGNAVRPLDVVRTRKGLTVEIGNTDAEGRVILADALAEAATEQPALLIDCATLTGAARVALGTEVPALFTNDDGLAESLMDHGRAQADPLWRLPLWPAYRRHVNGKVADLTNAPDHAFAGAITAALFLKEFVEPVASWVHLDVMAWNTDTRPGRPEGGEAMGMRALFALLAERYPA
jgi:leucyl aminopeptidase